MLVKQTPLRIRGIHAKNIIGLETIFFYYTKYSYGAILKFINQIIIKGSDV